MSTTLIDGKYSVSTGKPLYKDGHPCSTCCGAYILGQIWLDESLCGPSKTRSGDATPFMGTGLATPSYYWRIWDWTANAGQELCDTWSNCSYAGGNPAQGTVSAAGALSGLLLVVRNFYSLTASDRYVDVQISSNGTDWPDEGV